LTEKEGCDNVKVRTITNKRMANNLMPHNQ